LGVNPLIIAPIIIIATVLTIRKVDEFDFAAAANVTWGMHTYAKVTVDPINPRLVTLVHEHGGNNVTLYGTLLAVDAVGKGGGASATNTGKNGPVHTQVKAVFAVDAVVLQPPQNPTKGLFKLTVLAHPNLVHRIVVSFSLTPPSVITAATTTHLTANWKFATKVAPLADWPKHGPFVH
jgi:hypothetical protein